MRRAAGTTDSKQCGGGGPLGGAASLGGIGLTTGSSPHAKKRRIRMERYVLDPALIAQQGAASRRLAEERFDVRRVTADMLAALPLPENALAPAAPVAPGGSDNAAPGNAASGDAAR